MSRRKRRARKTPQPQPQTLADSFVLRYDQFQIHDSAHKHGINESEIRHAHNHAIRIFEYFDESQRERILIIGPDRSGNMLELIAAVLSDQTARIFHAMKLRPKFEDSINERKDKR